MKQNDKKTFALRVKPEGSVRVNRFLILSLVALLIFVFILVVVEAFAPSKIGRQIEKQKVVAGDLTTIKHSAIDQLPTSYSDTDEIKKYLQPAEVKVGIPPEVKQELSELRSQQTFLQQRIAELLHQRIQPEQSMNDMRLRQAKNSGLFFPGVAPSSTDVEQKSLSKDEPSAAAKDGEASGGKQDAYTSQNMQAQKMDFLKPSNKDTQIYNRHPLLRPISSYELQAGTLIPAILVTAINTNLPGTVVAQVRQNIFDTVLGQSLLIPKGSKLIGEYQSKVSYGQERVLIAFTRIIRPDGSSMQLDKYSGADLYGQAGMQGYVDNHWGRVLGAATLSTLISVGAGVASDRYQSDTSGIRTARQGAILGGADSVSDTGQQLTSRAMDIQPTLTIPIGYEFNIIVKKDVVMAPYALPNQTVGIRGFG